MISPSLVEPESRTRPMLAMALSAPIHRPSDPPTLISTGLAWMADAATKLSPQLPVMAPVPATPAAVPVMAPAPPAPNPDHDGWRLIDVPRTVAVGRIRRIGHAPPQGAGQADGRERNEPAANRKLARPGVS